MSCLDNALALNTSLMVFVNASFSQTPISEGSDYQLNIMNNIWLCKSVAGLRKRRDCTDSNWLVHYPQFDSSDHHTSPIAYRHNSHHSIGTGTLLLTEELDKSSHVWLSHCFQTYTMCRGVFLQLQSVRGLCMYGFNLFMRASTTLTSILPRCRKRQILRSKHQTLASDLVPAVTLARID